MRRIRRASGVRRESARASSPQPSPSASASASGAVSGRRTPRRSSASSAASVSSTRSSRPGQALRRRAVQCETTPPQPRHEHRRLEDQRDVRLVALAAHQRRHARTTAALPQPAVALPAPERPGPAWTRKRCAARSSRSTPPPAGSRGDPQRLAEDRGIAGDNPAVVDRQLPEAARRVSHTRQRARPGAPTPIAPNISRSSGASARRRWPGTERGRDREQRDEASATVSRRRGGDQAAPAMLPRAHPCPIGIGRRARAIRVRSGRGSSRARCA